ncbi:UbiA family prenyltransferase [Candidatus Woesearchaeota archaeon]|nr:UbiA family prenyltransferase [Candidatus Woesearchaeota archaeon]
MKNLLLLCRPRQWYKNLLVFLPLIFSGNLFNVNLLLITVYGFILLVMVSSANYIINDIVDIKKDRLVKEKTVRPLAAGKVKVWQAFSLSILLLFASFYFSYSLNIYFFYAALFLFGFTLLYSLLLKLIFLVDAVSISINFVVRAVAGAFIIEVVASNWLIAGIFFFALFLVISKRYGEVILFRKKAAKHRAVLKYYTPAAAELLLYNAATIVIVCFGFFAVLSKHRYLLLDFPVFVYGVLRYIQLIQRDKSVAINPEKSVKDISLLIAAIVFVFLAILSIYFL